MFGFSLQKLLVLAAIVAIVWYGFKYVGRLQQMRDASNVPRARKRRWPGRAQRAEPPAEGPTAEDMVQCAICDAYVPARGTSGCGRADCPY